MDFEEVVKNYFKLALKFWCEGLEDKKIGSIATAH